MIPSDAAVEALARRLEDTETELAYWQLAYKRLASNRLGWITALCRNQKFGLTSAKREQFIDRVRATLRGTW